MLVDKDDEDDTEDGRRDSVEAQYTINTWFRATMKYH